MNKYSKPFITIAIPTYNRADKYLRQTLECATRQNYENIEILVSDNCSTDETPEVVRSFSDPRIKFYQQQENLGAYGNWNFLLDKARGDYFHMYHDDDRIDVDFIETCMEGAEYRKGLALIMSGSRVIDQHDNILRENENRADGAELDDFILSWYRGEINIFFCSSLFNTEILRSVGGFEPKYDHYIDVAAQFKCMAAGERADVPDVKASFRKHKGSITSQTSDHINNWINDAKRLLDLALTLAPNKKQLIKKIGLKKSAMNVYMYANEIESKKERSKAFLKIYRAFGYRYFPQMKYANQLVPSMGYLLHPYRALSLLKSKILNSLRLA
ncbi:glycosyltransferase [Halalkalibaculum sp. DA3122]|uniref:glycosyltransferase n=1 Tax=Halalkalibaculum sp. DA3122 TaxID=3373607 RepID=UPI003754B571